MLIILDSWPDKKVAEKTITSAMRMESFICFMMLKNCNSDEIAVRRKIRDLMNIKFGYNYSFSLKVLANY